MKYKKIKKIIKKVKKRERKRKRKFKDKDKLMKFGKLVRQFDLFAKPFLFLVDGKKTKSSLIGGAMSICILGVSLGYMYYLLNSYFDKKVQPRITQNIDISNDRNTIHINENFFIFEMLIGGEPLKRYEKRVGKQYLTYKVYYEEYGSDGVSKYEILPLEECDDPQFDGFLCVSRGVINGKDLYYEPMKKLYSDYAIMVVPCDKTESDNCATEEEIFDVIFKVSNFFQLFTKIVQYNANERQFKTSYRQEYIYFDLKHYDSYGRFAHTKTEKTDTIYDYKRVDNVFRNDDTLLERMDVEGYACIIYEINEIHNYIYVQHATIAEVLAQFNSMFNSMLLIGFIARMFAESNILDDITNILLQEYYKQTALKLVQKKQSSKKQNNKLKKEKNQDNKNLQTQVEIDKNSKQYQTIELSNTIQKTNFSENKKQYFKLGFWTKIKLSILNLFGQPNLLNAKSDRNYDTIIYKNLLQQSIKKLNILDVYKDLIKLKMAVKLVLTKDQYAAIHFCGSDIVSHQSLQSKILINKQENNYQKISNNNKNQKKTPLQKEDQIIFVNNDLQTKLESQAKSSLNISDQRSLQNLNTQTFLNITNSNEPQQSNSKQIIQSIKNKQLENLQKSNIKIIQKYNFRNSNTQKMAGQKQTISQIELQTSFNNQIQTQQKKSQQIQERDHVQNLNLRGDDYIINTTEESIVDAREIEKSYEKKQQEIKVKPKLLKQQLTFKFHTLRHLQEMDRIEEDKSQREKFLQEFLDKMSQQQGDTINPDISYIDKQIYSSLIINESLI